MDDVPMHDAQRPGDPLWRLPRGHAMRLHVDRGERWLRVRAGRVWLTAQGRPGRPAEDLWLGPGDQVRLPRGASWVAEGWPDASFELVVPPGAEA